MIGDVLTTSILCEAIKNRYPDAVCDYLVNKNTTAVLENNPFISNLILFDPKIEKKPTAVYSFLKMVRGHNYDVVIDTYGKFISKINTRFSGADKRIGYKKKGNALYYTDTIKKVKKNASDTSVALLRRMALLQPLSINSKAPQPKIYITKSEHEHAQNFLKGNGIDSAKPLYMIGVLGSNPEKTYPLKYMSNVLDTIVSEQPKSQLLFNYIPSQEVDAKAIYDGCTIETQRNIYFNLYAKSLRTFITLTAQCDALIGNEGGAVNMAKAMGIPTFIIFAPNLKKANWFGSDETKNHTAVHLSDYITYQKGTREKAQENPKEYYNLFKPEFFKDELTTFIKAL